MCKNPKQIPYKNMLYLYLGSSKFIRSKRAVWRAMRRGIENSEERLMNKIQIRIERLY
jgi:hypothetical protein